MHTMFFLYMLMLNLSIDHLSLMTHKSAHAAFKLLYVNDRNAIHMSFKCISLRDNSYARGIANTLILSMQKEVGLLEKKKELREANFKEKINDEYRVNMILDNLPVVVLMQTREGSQTPSMLKDDKYYINNHLSFKVLYHEDQTSPDARIVGFHVIPIIYIYNSFVLICYNIKHEYGAWDDNNPTVQTCNANIKVTPGSHTPQEVAPDADVVFSYVSTFKFSIVNSLMIVLFLSGMVAMIMMITLYKDITNYNQLDDQDEAQEETGWKLVHGDVFRAPVHSSLLCVYAGTSVQFFGMTLLTMMFALLGFLSPANRGGLMTAMVLFWVFMGGERSSGAVPFGTMFALFLLWFGISVSLVFVGSFLGFKQLAIEDPVKTNKIHRQITEQAWYLQPVFAILASGILPFGTVFIELFFILTSIWLNQFYYIFGFLFKVFVVLVVT
ncbi:hypothetical protein ACJX0J_028315, partial [Zea mays]